MNKPLFTVVIPTFNRAEYLQEAIQSVLLQTYKNYELIIVDDRSTDNTKDVLNSFHDERINYVINDRVRGGAGTRNAGIFRAKGEWVAFLDDDDIWLSSKLEQINKMIQKVDYTVGLIYSGIATYDFDKKQEKSIYIPDKQGWIQNELLYKNYIGSFSAVAIRNSLLKEVGGLDERFKGMQDMELYVRIANRTRIVCIKEVLVYKRVSNTDSITFNASKKLESSLLFWDKYRELINKNYRLRHRAASRVFIHAIRQENRKYIIKAMPWTYLGLLIDFKNFIWTFRRALSIIYRR